MPNPTIVSAALNDKELRDSITKLVEYYKNGLNDMKDATTKTVGEIQEIIKSIGSTKVDFSGTLDGLEKAKKKMTTAASGGGSGTSAPPKDKYADGTIGALEETIRLEEKKRKEMELGTKELRDQNKLIEEQKNKLKGEKSSNTIAENAKKATKELGNAMSKSSATLSLAQDRLRALIDLQNKYRNSQDLSIKQQNRLTDAIEQTKKKIASFQKKATTTSGQPMGFWDVKNSMPEDSIEDIRNKMKALRQVKAQDAYESKLLADEYQRLKRKQNELMGSSIQLTKSNNYLAQSFGYIRNRIVYALTLGALTSFVKQIYEIRGQYEMLERSLGVLVNSFERGSQVFRELSEMALKSPFTLIELGTAAKQLTAYNFSANEVVDTTRRLADLSAALGVPTERLVYNLGQIRAQTRLTARDARDFANAGLPIVKNLADYYTNLEGKIVSTGDVYDRMTKKMVSYGDVMAVINQATDEGGKFFDFQAKQANTLKVQMANLDLAWNNMLNDLGKSNQGLLTAPIAALKTIFQSWKDINHIIWTLISAYGILKVAQVVAITNEMKWAAAAGGTARAMGSIANAINGVIGKFGALVSNPWTWVFIGIGALADLGVSWYQNTKAIMEFNNEIRKASEEGASALSKMLDNKGNKATLKLASENKLTAEQGEKAWNAIKEEMETSVASSNRLIQELLKIDDINKRVSKGFEYAEKINAANLALSEMNNDMIKITKSWGVFGIFGEGLADDLADLKEELSGIGGQIGMFDEQGRVNENLGSGFKEYRDELEVTANSIKNFFDAYDIKDPLQMQEVLERVRSQIKAKNPEIQGELARLFDVTLDQRMNTLTNGAIDANTSLWKIFMDNLRRSSSSAFSDISDDIYNESTKLTKEQQDAVDKNLEYFKKTMPYYYDAVKSMVENASQLKIQIGLTFNVQQLTDFQKEVNKRIKEKFGDTIGADQFNAFLPTSNDDLISFTKTQQEAIAKLKEDNKKYEKDKSEWAKRHIAENNTEIEQHKKLLDLFNQSYVKETKGGKGKQRDIVLDALKEEISLTKKLQGEYDKLTSKGATHADAIEDVQERYSNTIKLLDKDLGKFGLPKFDTNIITGKDPNKQLEYFKNLRDILESKGLLNLDRSKVVDAVIQELDVSAKTYNLDKVTKGLNNELDRLKDEYELAVSLDADPELGNMFADWMGIDVSNLPRTASEYAERASKELNSKLKELGANIELPNLLSITDDDMRAFEQSKTLTQAQLELVKKRVEEARGFYKKEVDDRIKDWDKLLEKYAEYETKVTKIHNDAEKERETARRMNAPRALFEAIDLKERQQLAKVAFEKFQGSSEWIVATGNLEGMTKKAIGGLIDSIEEYKKKANDLDPKQIKQINNALKALHKEQRKNNPFKALADAMDEAKDRSDVFQAEIDAEQEKLNKLSEAMIYGGQSSEVLSKAIADTVERIKELKKKQEEVSGLSTTEMLEYYNSIYNTVKQTYSVFSDMIDKLGGSKLNNAFNKLTGMLDKISQGAQIGSAFGAKGAAIGAFVGALSGIASEIADSLNGNEQINDEIEDSILQVKRLQNEYKTLSDEVERAYGIEEIAAKKAAEANKQVQLAELKRQLILEQSRKRKNQDSDKIEDLKGQIIDLELEIQNSTKEMVNSLLGISGIGNAAESLVSSMIDAFKSGEDYMGKYVETFNNMIDNMIMKSIVGRVIGEKLEQMFKQVEEFSTKRADETKFKAEDFTEGKYRRLVGDTERTFEGWMKTFENWLANPNITEDDKEETREWIENLKKMYEQAATPSVEDIKSISEKRDEWQDEIKDTFDAYMEALGITYGQDASKSLSALQQGIQGITEDTAGALEGYMNGVSQQVYYQSDLLTQIRDTVIGFDLDVQVATMSQILLQLQSSYTVQMSIQGILEGTLNPSGQGFRVELIS